MILVTIANILAESRSPAGAYSGILNQSVELKFQLSDLGHKLKELQANSVDVPSLSKLGMMPADLASDILNEGLKFQRDVQQPLVSYQYNMCKRRVEFCEKVLAHIETTFLADCPDRNCLLDYDFMSAIDECCDNNDKRFDVITFFGNTLWTPWLLGITSVDACAKIKLLSKDIGSYYEVSTVQYLTDQTSRDAELAIGCSVSSK